LAPWEKAKIFCRTHVCKCGWPQLGMHVRPHTPAPPGINSWGAPAQMLRCAALCCLQLVDVPELEEEGKEDLTRRVRGWAHFVQLCGDAASSRGYSDDYLTAQCACELSKSLASGLGICQVA
jgi:hypothetical protein